MKKIIFAVVLIGSFGLAAQAISGGTSSGSLYNFTDFNKTRVKYRIGGFASAEAAHAAATNSLQNLLDGNLPQARMMASGRDKCKDVNSNRSKKAISQYIKKRGQYSGVKAFGFQLSENFDAAGSVSYGALLNAQIPCLKRNSDDDDDDRGQTNSGVDDSGQNDPIGDDNF